MFHKPNPAVRMQQYLIEFLILGRKILSVFLTATRLPEHSNVKREFLCLKFKEAETTAIAYKVRLMLSLSPV